MGGEFIDPALEPGEGQVVARQHQRVLMNRPGDRLQRAEIDAERVAVGGGGLDADVGRNLGEHLIRGEKQPLAFAEQHDLIGRMAAAGQREEFAPADAKRVAGGDSLIGRRRRADDARIDQPLADDMACRAIVEAMRIVEPQKGLAIQGMGIAQSEDRLVVFDRAGDQRRVARLSEPSGETDMVGVGMGGDDARQALLPQQAAEQRRPHGAHVGAVEPGVDQREAAIVLDQIDVDVVETKGERQTQPEQAGRDFDRLAGLRGNGKRKLDRSMMHVDARSLGSRICAWGRGSIARRAGS